MKKLRCILTAVILSLATMVNVFAYTSVDEVAQKYGPGGTNGNAEWPAELGSYFSTSSTSGEAKNIIVGSTIYYYEDEAKIIAAAESLDSKAKSEGAMTGLSEAIEQTTGGGADFAGAAGLLSGFVGPFQKIIGLILILAIMGTMVSTGLDIFYMSIPAMQEAGSNAIESGNSFLTKADKQAGDGSRRLRFISKDAIKAVQVGDQSDKYPILIYAKRRAIILIATFVVIWFMASNKYMIIAEKTISLLEGVLKLFN